MFSLNPITMETTLPQVEKNTLFQQTFLKALVENQINLTQWKEYKEKYEDVIRNLKYYNEKHQHSILLPVGKKAFAKGKLVHTNDVWVTLGCGWFLKTSSKKAIDICERRIKSADELIAKWEKESKLLENMREFSKGKDTFAQGGSKEIEEPYNEETEAHWKVEHREKEKKYRQQLKELKEKTGSASVNTEKDIWEHLEALELQEELEDELNRLGCNSETSSEDDEQSVSSNSFENQTTDNEKAFENREESNRLVSKSNSQCDPFDQNKITRDKKTVSFNLPPDETTKSILNDIEQITKNKNQPVAVTDTVYENVTKSSSEINIYGTKRPVSKFKRNRNETKQ